MICGLDIGTSKTKILLVERNKEGNLELISKAEEPTEGVRRGVIIDGEKVSNILSVLFQKIAAEVGEKINSVYTALNGSHLFSVFSRGLISVSRADQKISEEDVQRVLQAAQTINLPSNKEIFDAIVKEFIVDGQAEVKKAVGLQGVRLEAEVLALGGFSPYLENQKKAILGADLEVLDAIPAPVAAARAVLNEKQKELGVAVVDIGAGTTGLAVFEEGDLLHLAVLPIGSDNITDDIAIGLKIDVEVAERIKQEYGSCLFKGKDMRQKINFGGNAPLIFSKKFLVKIISDRVSELFNLVNQELKKIRKEKLLPGGIVLTGGGAKLPKILDLAKDKLHLPVRIGRPKGIFGLEEDLRLAVVCGLVLYGAECQAEEKNFKFGSGITSKIKKFLRIFIP